MYVSLYLLTKCSKHRSWNRYTKHRSWNWCENVAEQIIGRLSQGEKIAKTKMSDWFLVRFLSNIWKKKTISKVSRLSSTAPQSLWLFTWAQDSIPTTHQFWSRAAWAAIPETRVAAFVSPCNWGNWLILGKDFFQCRSIQKEKCIVLGKMIKHWI